MVMEAHLAVLQYTVEWTLHIFEEGKTVVR
jgi:hypothetical protein